MKDSIRFAEILISTEIEITNDIITQKFFYDKKDQKYLLDSMYLLYEKFEDALRKYSLSNHEEVTFLHRVNDDGVTILTHEVKNENTIKKIDTSRKVFKLVNFVPPTNGCAFCRYKQELNENFFYCQLKEKTMTKEIKKCKVFKQKKLYKT